MTADYIAFHAIDRPDAVAFVNNGRSVTYGEFSRDIGKFTRALRELDLPRGGSVAVGCRDRYVHFLLLLACERLGIAAASYRSNEGPACLPLLASVELVLAAPDYPVGSAKRHHALTPAWIEGVLAAPDESEEPPLPKTPGDPVRIVRTSGTTGVSKRFVVLRRMHGALAAQWGWAFGLSHASRYLLTLPLTVRATYDFGCACLRAGGTVVYDNRTRVSEALTAHAITHTILLPLHLQSLLEQLPGDFTKPRELTILSFGAGVSRVLRERAMARLATALCDLYGTVEVTAISTAWRHDTDGSAMLWPLVELEAVDERHEPVAPGAVGRIRVKTPAMSEGYLDDPETTRRMFRDGWFYPGDVGIPRPGRRLQILGRADDLLNIGGNKYAPAVLEELIANRDLAGDAAVCSLENADGIEELCIAVANPRYDGQALKDAIAGALRDIPTGRLNLVKMARIPRSANGKLDRKLLKEAVARAVRGNRPDQE